ncbi:MAG: ABC transporter ATP-binding protein [Syntrophomonadaceae bacterium]|jgi:simple sugar transport system ATP-binding protein|nr:ABC transporter ATP-binding protein [Syntrophomonadaceae bacterium]
MKRFPVIEMDGITKSFPGVLANNNVSFRVYPGEIHALLGENGAGKSTLMSILAGLYRPDAGYIKVKGVKHTFKSPRKALTAGIGMIYQHFRLVNNFTVAENIILGTKNSIGMNSKKIEKEASEFASRFGFDINPNAKVFQLSLGEQQKVEIIKMLYRGCDVLIMDEPTTVLTPQEVKDLFNTLKLMAAQGKAVVLITHKLHEVMEVADYVTVLRRGEVVGSNRIEEVEEASLAKMMVAHEVVYNEVSHQMKAGNTILELNNIDVYGDQGYLAVRDINLSVKSGEIVAIAGVAGNGQRELIEAIAGLRKLNKGSIYLEGQEITNLNIRQRLARGLNVVPEDRIGMGLVSNLNVLENVILRTYYNKEFLDGMFIDYKAVHTYAEKLVEDYNIFLSDLKHPINYMSGGNLQKLLLAREISQHPRLLVAAYPSRGLDIAAAESVYNILLQERNKGTGILLILEDLDDIFRYADRVAVMYEGGIKQILNVADTNIDEIGALMLGTQYARKLS